MLSQMSLEPSSALAPRSPSGYLPSAVSQEHRRDEKRETQRDTNRPGTSTLNREELRGQRGFMSHKDPAPTQGVKMQPPAQQD